ncbi:rCG25820 [Rattus norvegicus]|uniref:RCG25820 n=1 Tax=Rattus norvegicus TaxID=10116 RepID=A6I3N3_RAT|nr:rCG25820 [Rattus norvegicus]
MTKQTNKQTNKQRVDQGRASQKISSQKRMSEDSLYPSDYNNLVGK